VIGLWFASAVLDLGVLGRCTGEQWTWASKRIDITYLGKVRRADISVDEPRGATFKLKYADDISTAK
jgi:hypothetical protein